MAVNKTSDAFWSAIEGSTDNDVITMTGKGSTISTYRGDDLIELGNNSWTSSNLVYAGAGNDTIKINSSATVYGDAGNDYFGIYGLTGGNGYGDLILYGGDGADYFYLDTSSLSQYLDYTISKTTITGGAGSDTININPSVKNISFVVTDFSSEDVFVNETDSDGGEFLSYSTISNGIVLQDTEPNTFSVTLQGMSLNDFGKIKYVYNGGQTTFGEIFGIVNQINNGNYNVSIKGTDGSDSINNYGIGVTINAGSGNDVIKGVRRDEYLYDTEMLYNNLYNGGKGNDTITVTYHSNSVIDGGDGDDSIVANVGTYSTHINENMIVYGGAGNDTITFNGENSTFYGGTGDDVISLSNSYNGLQGYRLIVYETGDGNDTIYSSALNDTVSLGGCYYTQEKVGNDVVISILSGGSITVKNTSIYNVKIVGGTETVANPFTTGDDYYANSVNSQNLDALAGNDTIVNYTGGYNSKINGGAGNDSIMDYALSNTIYGGAGNDSIKVSGHSHVYGNADNDFIVVSSGDEGRNTINAGTGNDIISLGGGVGSNGYSSSDYGGDYNLIIYSSGDGKDTIYNYNSTDTISLGGGVVYTRETVGSDVVVSIDGSNSITLKNASSKTVYINGGTETVMNPFTEGNDAYSNFTANTVLNVLAGDDVIGNFESRVTINGDAGNDTIINTANSVIANGGIGNDSIENQGGYYVTIAAGDGNDYISNYGYPVTIDGGTGNDTIYNSGRNAKITGGAGKDSIRNYGGDSVNIDAGNDNDYIYNYTSSSVSINAGAGDDYIENSVGSYTTINAGEGKDTVYNYADSISINGGAGNDSIYSDSTSGEVSINGGTGDDTIKEYGNNSTINGGDDNDSIYHVGNNSSITGGNGDDTIIDDYISGTNVNYGNTLNGGAGNDVISVSTRNRYAIQYSQGDGNDTITGLNENDTLHITSGNISNSVASGNDVVLTVGTGTITLKDAAGQSIYLKQGTTAAKVVTLPTTVNPYYVEGTNVADYIENTLNGATINALAGNDTIDNRGDEVSINAAAGNDCIYNRAVNVTIFSGTGNDSIKNTQSGTHTKILAGDGNDSIEGVAYYSTIDGGIDNDYISIAGSYNSMNAGAGNDIIGIMYSDYIGNTIKGGTGNDTIYGDTGGNYGVLYQYASGDGNDVIYNYKSADTVSLSGVTYIRETVGNDVLISITSGGEILLKNASSKTVNIVGGIETVMAKFTEGNDYYENVAANAILNGLSGKDTIDNTNAAVYSTIDGGDGDDTIRNYANFVTINGGSGNDFIYNSSMLTTIKGGKGNDTVFIGATAAGKQGILYQYSSGDGNDLIYDFSSYDTISLDTGLTYTRSTVGNDVIVSIVSGGAMTLSGASGKTVNIVGGTPTIINPFTTGNDYYSNTTGSTILNALAGNDTIENEASRVTINGDAGNDTITNSASSVVANGGAGSDYISNTASNVTIDGGTDNDTINSSGGSINGGAGNDRISISGGGTIKGGTGNDTIYSSSGSNGVLFQYAKGDGADVINNYKSADTVSLSGVTYTRSTVGNDVVVSVDGSNSITLKNASNKTVNIVGGTPTIINPFTTGNDYYSNTTGSTILNALAGNDTIENEASRVTINGDAGNDTITNSASSVVANGGTGSDYISNTASNVTIDGGTDNDTIYNSEGNRVHINLGDGNDTMYATDNDNITVYGGAGSDSVTGSFSNSRMYGDAGKDLISISGENNIIDGGADDDTINSSGGSINGGAGNDRISIRGGGTVKGGTGNDTIYGSSGSNGVLYQFAKGDGADTVNNYKSNDTISVGNVTYTRETVDNDVIVKILDGGSMTLKNAKSRIINIIDGTLTVASSFTDDDNFYSNTTGDTVLNALAGNDMIENDASRVTINGDAGNDTITNSESAQNVVVNGGTGNDTVTNYGENVTINGGAGSDRIENYAANVTIDGGDDNDTINSFGSGFITGGKGADKISVTADSVTIDGGDDNDTVYSYNGGSIEGGAGDDKISITSSASATINGGAGNDMINAYYGSINGGAGNDVISLNSAAYSKTVTGGKGNDIIYGESVTNNGMLYQYSNGDGNDIIYGWKASDTLNLGGASYSKTVEGSDIVYTVGSGKITLVGVKDQNITIENGNSLDIGENITNKTSNKVINGNAFDDTIKNSSANKVTIIGGTGKDYIYSKNGSSLYIDGGEDDDTIKTDSGDNNSINGGAGNDVISLKSQWEATVNAGRGDDKIYSDSVDSSGILFQYENGDGNDVITGWKNSDSITISGGSHSTQLSGNNVIVKVGEGNITLKGAKGKTVNIYSEESVIHPSEKDVIQKFMKVLDENNSDGRSRLDYAVSVASGGYFKSIDAAMNQMVADCKNAGNSDTFLKDCCGIDLSNDDTGAITGSDAGGTETKTATSIVPESGSLNKSFKKDNFTTSSGLKVKLSSNFEDLSDTEKNIWRGLKTWWMESALNLIKESYGENFGFGPNSSATVTEIEVEFSTDTRVLAAVDTLGMSTTTRLRLRINKDYFQSADPDSKATIKDKEYYLDRTLAHEMTHAVMAANINYHENLPRLIREGMSELTHGIDDEKKSEIQNLAGNSELLKKSLRISTDFQKTVSVKQNKKTVTVDNPDYVAGYMFLRYLAKQGAEKGNYLSTENWNSNNKQVTVKDKAVQTGVTVKSGVLTVKDTFDRNRIDLSEYSSAVTKVNATNLSKDFIIIGNTLNNSIKSGGGADVISANVGNDTVYGGKGDDVIYGDAGNDSIFGEDGNDTLYGSSGKNTLSGGKGNDIFVHDNGEDIITDYEVGKDKIIFASGEIDSVTVSGKNVIFQNTSGNVTVQGGNGKKITVIDSTGSETTKTYGSTLPAGISVSGKILTAASTFKGNAINLADYSGVTKVKASDVKKALTITGNSSANSLVGGTKNDTIYGGNGKDILYGGKGADKIYGDAGNDTLYGDAGKDTIYGGLGNDSIFGGADNDSLFGEDGNDTLNGGLGNDTLYGGNGNDVFVYEGGKDVITDYTAGKDKIKISSKITKTYSSGNDFIFKIGSGLITVKDGKGKKITVLDANNKSTTYKKTVELFDDDNFVTDAVSLDSITEQKFTVQNIQTENYNSLAQDSKNYLTFADK